MTVQDQEHCLICGNPMPCDRHIGAIGWVCLAGFVLAWDVLSPETLSTVFGRHRKHPLVVAAWAVTTAHLFGVLPKRYDPFRFFRR